MKLSPATRLILLLLTLFLVALGLMLEIRMRAHVDRLVEQVGENMTGSMDSMSQGELEIPLERINANAAIYTNEELKERLFEIVAPTPTPTDAGDD